MTLLLVGSILFIIAGLLFCLVGELTYRTGKRKFREGWLAGIDYERQRNEPVCRYCFKPETNCDCDVPFEALRSKRLQERLQAYRANLKNDKENRHSKE